jgi:hypothetical protein
MPATYNFPDHYKGDGLTPITITLDADLTDASARIDFRKEKTGDYALRLSTVDDTITIPAGTAADGIIVIPAQIIDIDAGVYYYDLEVTPDQGLPKTWLQGTMTVLQDVTYE